MYLKKRFSLAFLHLALLPAGCLDLQNIGPAGNSPPKGGETEVPHQIQGFQFAWEHTPLNPDPGLQGAPA